MAFTAALRTRPGMVILDLEGDLDSTTAPEFRSRIEEAAAVDPDTLVVDMTRLAYLSSAGLRGLVFARQKMGLDTLLVLVGANEAVTETIRLTGFDHSVTFSERVPE
jgi:anti-anti-sigma factor